MYKRQIPQDADLVFDVRFLPNTYYIEELRPLSGNNAPVSDYVMSFDLAHEFSDELEDLIRFLIPNYITEDVYKRQGYGQSRYSRRKYFPFPSGKKKYKKLSGGFRNAPILSLIHI